MTIEKNGPPPKAEADHQNSVTPPHSTVKQSRETISNADFLTALFDDRQAHEYLWACWFDPSPNSDDADWSGEPTEGDIPDFLKNAYFSVAYLTRDAKGERRRRKDNFSRLPVLVLDDAEGVELAPTWKLETSPGNFQIGFKLSAPITDVSIAKRVHDAVANLGKMKADTSGNNTVRYVRLPCGTNNKYGEPFAHRLIAWNPEIRHSLDDLVDALGLVLAPPAADSKPPAERDPMALREDDGELIRQIVTGETYHDATMTLCARYAARGVPEKLIADFVQGMMKAAPDVGSERWKSRFADVPRLARSAIQKFAKPTAGHPARRLLSVADLMAQPLPEWRVKGLLPAKGVAAIYGPSGSGKSFLTLDLCMAIAAGRTAWFGHRVKPAPVVYVALEGQAGYRLRLGAWQKHSARDAPAAFRMTLDPLLLSDALHIRELAELCPRGAVVVVDTLAQAAPGADENSGKDMGLLLAHAQMLAGWVDGLVILIAHTGKDEERGLRGWSGITAALDAALATKGDRDSLVKEWRADKVKDGGVGKSRTFTLEVIELGVDDDLDPITSCVVLEGGTPPPKVKPLPKGAAFGLETLREACEASG